MSPKPVNKMTEYVKMLLASEDIAPLYGLIAYISSWILLQGYVIFPSTLIALYNPPAAEPPQFGTTPLITFDNDFLTLFRNFPQFVVACILVFMGGCGMVFSFWNRRRNYVWVRKEVISPGLYGALTGLVATLANLGAQKWQLTTASKVALYVTGGASGFFAILWFIYKYILLRHAKKKHIDETGYYVGVGENGEGIIQTKESVEGPGTMIGNVVSWVSNGPLQ